jgi:S-adenosylmethionine/arginine decarboxylase-like enzyme
MLIGMPGGLSVLTVLHTANQFLICEVTQMNNGYWGYSLNLDCAGCDPVAIRDYDHIFKFNQELVRRIDMEAYGDPQIVNFGHGDKAGFSSLQWISTSSIVGHYVNELNQIYLDVFSCKPFDIEEVEATVMEFFGPTSIRKYYITRQA